MMTNHSSKQKTSNRKNPIRKKHVCKLNVKVDNNNDNDDDNNSDYDGDIYSDNESVDLCNECYKINLLKDLKDMTKKPEVITIGDNKYYIATEIRDDDPKFFSGCVRNIQNIIDKKRMTFDDYAYANYDDINEWVKAKNQYHQTQNSILLLNKDWVDDNVPSMMIKKIRYLEKTVIELNHKIELQELNNLVKLKKQENDNLSKLQECEKLSLQKELEFRKDFYARERLVFNKEPNIYNSSKAYWDNYINTPMFGL